MPKVEYRGGIPDCRKTGLTIATVFPDYLDVQTPGFSFKAHKILYEQILNVSFSPEGAKKKNYVLNVEYKTVDGFISVAVLTGSEVSELYGSLQKARKSFPLLFPAKAAAMAEFPATVPVVDVAAELQKFYELMKSGVITEDEFNAKKAQLLGV